MSKQQPDWLNNGIDNIWLPYAQMQNTPTPLAVKSTKGTIITLEGGRELIDGIASWWSACHGYNHPHILDKMHAQIDLMPHIMFAGLAHEPAYILAQRLVKITPNGLNKVFFADSGSTSVEVAIKMATQYWYNKNESKRNKFVCFKNAYHGDTMGAMSLADMDDGMHKAFSKTTPKQYIVGIPKDEYDFAELEEMLKGIAKTTAGIIIEPLVQGAGGMKFHTPDILAEIYRIAKKYDILFIADEIATGFCRTGYMFACEEAGITPDIMCIGKALTGGTISLAATITTNEIFDAFLSDSLDSALMHGPTFMANPLACAAANASLDLFEAEDYSAKTEAIQAQLIEELKPLKKHSNIAEVRVKGAIGVVELQEQSWGNILKMRSNFIRENIWLRPFGNIIYVMPALNITENELSKISASIVNNTI